MGPTPCQVGRGRVRVWVESGTGRGRVGVDSVSSRAGSSRGLGRVGDGSGSYWGRLRFKSGRVGSGAGWSRGRAGVVFGCQSLATNHGDVSICSGSLRFNMKVAPMLKDHLSFNACASVIASQKSLALFVCMVAPILKDHLNTNACVSGIVRAKRAERCLCVCGGGWWCVLCVWSPPY